MRISTRRLCGRSVGLLVLGATLVASAATAARAADVQLIQAVKDGDAPALRALLGRGADVDARQGDGATALHWAAHLNDLDAADLLIRAGADVDATNDLGVTPLWVATTAGGAGMVATLLEARADPDIAPDTGGTPLMIAARQGNVAAVRSLLAHGADMNATEGAQGQTALMWAVARRHPQVVRVLLEVGADPHARTRSSRRHVLLCCQKSLGKTEGTVWIEQGGFTPLLFAARHGAAAAAELLLAAGAPVDDTAAIGTTPLVVAAQHGFHDVAAVLLERGADPDAAGAGQAALHWAALRGDRELVETLLAHGADPDVRLARGSFLKHDRGAFAFDKFLIGATPFVVAARRSDTRIMQLLAAGGADASLPLQDGRTAAMVAAGGKTTGLLRLRLAEEQILETVRSALDLGVDPNAASLSGDAVLHVAAGSKFDSVIRLLAERGALVNARNRMGQTPLAVALAPPEAPDGSAIGGAALGRYREAYAAWAASRGQTPTANLLRSLGGTE
ncbi:MAG: ankyrin repeat domain-containing protein [Acidobacteria bacterium]|nr:ankyrin repeat domain-containing protein [Acidobacteriota bacterium]